MAFDPSKATRAATIQPGSNATFSDPNGNPFTGYTPTTTASGLVIPGAFKPQNDAQPYETGHVPGPYDAFREQLKEQNPGIPPTWIDAEVDNFNEGQTIGGGHFTPPNPNDPNSVTELNRVLQGGWNNEPNRDDWIKKDQDAKTAQQTQDIIQGAARTGGQNTQAASQAIANNWNKNVAPAIQNAVVTAPQNQIAVDRQQEAVNDQNIGNYTNTLNSLESQRMSGINATNAQLTDLANQFRGATDSTNASNSQFATQFQPIADNANNLNSGLVQNLWGATDSTNAANSALGQQLMQAAASTNANQTGLYNTLDSQAQSINANQTGLYNTLAGQAASINGNQVDLFNTLAGQANLSNAALEQANGQFQGQLGDLNAAQDNANFQFQDQLTGLNNLDRSSLDRYMGETDPLMQAMQARGSDPADIARQQDVIQRYKDLSTPQVTDQERLVAELARRKFESDDQANREALMAQLAGRGLRSGGMVIAGLQAANQQTSNDRQMAELGLNAQAQQRAMQGLAGYADQSNVLRNADDAMRNFQDQYAQNDAVRRGNLADQRETMNLAETGQETNRDALGFNANTTTINNNTQRDALGFDANRNTINDNYNRDESVFNAGTVTNNNNYARDESVFNAGTVTNNSNFARDQAVFNAGTTTNEDNYGRTSNAVNTNFNINQGNLGNTQFATTTNIGVNNQNADRSRQAVLDNIGVNQTNLGNTALGIGTQMTTASGNDARTQGGINSGETAAGGILTAQQSGTGFKTQNAANEAGTAQGAAGTAIAGGTGFNTVQGTIAGMSQDEINRRLGLAGLGAATTAAQKAT